MAQGPLSLSLAFDKSQAIPSGVLPPQGAISLALHLNDSLGAPTAERLLALTRVDFDSLGFDTTEKVQDLVDQAIATVYRYTGAGWDDSTGEFTGGPEGTEASRLEPLGRQAVQTIAEMFAFRAQPDVPETLSDFDLIANFSVGSYSESRRMEGSRYTSGGPELLSALQVLLWPLMDDDHQDQWIQLFGGTNRPAFGVTEVDWGANGSYTGLGRYGGAVLGGLPQDPFPYPS